MPLISPTLGAAAFRRLAAAAVRDARTAVVALTLPVFALGMLIGFVHDRRGGWALLGAVIANVIATLGAAFILGFVVSFVWRWRRLSLGVAALAREVD